MITVYLSSTFQDLKEYRAQVLDYFNTMKDRFRVINMEGYTAEDKIVYKKCMADVAACDLYILIIGKKYGSVATDPDDPGFNRAEGFSYTHYEYLQAKADKASGRTEILMFRAAPDAQLPESDPDGKLAAFCQAEVAGRLAGNFSTPVDLEIQLNRALANRFFRVRAYDDRLVYKCDRVSQNDQFSWEAAGLTGPIRSIMLHGREDALCHNFVNKLSIFDLSLKEPGGAVSFEHFISDNHDYDRSLQQLLRRLYLSFSLPRRAKLTEATLIEDIQTKPGPAAIVIECYARNLEKAQITFLSRFLAACMAVPVTDDTKPFYLFLQLLEDDGDGAILADEKLVQLRAGLSEPDKFNILLDRLGSIDRGEIKNWLLTNITYNEGTALKMMERYFAGLPDTGITMEQANERLTEFIAGMNAAENNLEKYVNLY